MKFDAVIIGSGPAGMAKAVKLQKGGKKCLVISKGHSLYGYEPGEFEKAGGRILMGDAAVSSEITGGKVSCIRTENLGNTEICADEYWLATGRFFAGGLKSDMDRIYEPLFGLDVEYDRNPEHWFSERFADDQPFMHFGVKCSARGCALKDDEEITNLFPIGEIRADK